jgi:hypothetical protein
MEIVNISMRNFKGQKSLDVSLNPGINKIEGQNASGKAQPYNAKVLTINGFVNLGSIKIGDEIYTADGTLTKVTGVFPQGLKDCYKITLWMVGKQGVVTSICGLYTRMCKGQIPITLKQGPYH